MLLHIVFWYRVARHEGLERTTGDGQGMYSNFGP